jgi:two-component system, OmpR family, KDP operon response regulator KdpE
MIGEEQTPSVLLIEDDHQMLRFLKALLRSSEYRLRCEATGEAGIAAAAAMRPDIVLLDLGLPDIDGHLVVERLRAWSLAPVIVISAREGDDDKVGALDRGADDYLTKPFSSTELLARVRVALRHARQRATGAQSPVFESGDLRVDLARHEALRAGVKIQLTPVEFRVLAALVREAGRVLTHRQILREVWGPGSVEQTHYVRVYMGHLRRKLERDPARPQHLLTEPGVGYRLQ